MSVITFSELGDEVVCIGIFAATCGNVLLDTKVILDIVIEIKPTQRTPSIPMLSD
jgi:hypothetical protein